MDAVGVFGTLDAVFGAFDSAGPSAETCLTPHLALAGLWSVLLQISTAARGVEARGKSPGWCSGRVRRRKERHKVVKKGVFAASNGLKNA